MRLCVVGSIPHDTNEYFAAWSLKFQFLPRNRIRCRMSMIISR